MKDDPFEHLREQHRKSKEALQPLKERWEKQFQKPAKTKEEIKAERLQEVRGKLQDLAEKGRKLNQREKRQQQFKQFKAYTMKTIRYLLTIPVCLATIGVIYWAFELAFRKVFFWLVGLELFWSILILLFFGGMIWGLFKGLSFLIAELLSLISPNGNFSFWTITVICLINAIFSLIGAWSANYEYDGKAIFVLVMFTLFVTEMTYSLILGSLAALEDE